MIPSNLPILSLPPLPVLKPTVSLPKIETKLPSFSPMTLPPLASVPLPSVPLASIPSVPSSVPSVSTLPALAPLPSLAPSVSTLPALAPLPSLAPSVSTLPSLAPLAALPSLTPLASSVPFLASSVPSLASSVPSLALALASPTLPKFAPLKQGVEKPLLVDPLVKEIRETKSEQIEKIGKEIKKKEEIIGLSDEMKSLMGPLKPLSAAPIFSTHSEITKTKTKLPGLANLPSLPALPKPHLQEIETKKIETKGIEETKKTKEKSALLTAQEGVLTAKLIEPEAAFQKSEGLSIIASPANLPSKRSVETTPKIRIPKVKSSPVKPSPKSIKGITISGFSLPTTTTIIPPIPISSPSALSNISPASISSTDVMQNVMKIDLSKLINERSGKNEGYSVSELKSIAGSLNLTKSGNKKEIVERIKNAILKVNPNVVFG